MSKRKQNQKSTTPFKPQKQATQNTGLPKLAVDMLGKLVKHQAKLFEEQSQIIEALEDEVRKIVEPANRTEAIDAYFMTVWHVAADAFLFNHVMESIIRQDQRFAGAPTELEKFLWGLGVGGQARKRTWRKFRRKSKKSPKE